MYTPYLKWLLQNDVSISNIEFIIHYDRHQPLVEFAKEITEARLIGDIVVMKDGKKTKPFKAIGNNEKLIGNSAPGKLGENVTKWRKTVFCNKDEMFLLSNRIDFVSAEQIGEDWFQCSRLKRRILWNKSIQVYIAIYQQAKLEVLKFVFDFLDKVLDPLKWESVSTDTDCFGIALTGEFEDCVADWPLYEKLKPKYFPRTSKEISHYVTHLGKRYPITIAQADRRKPLLWKEESSGPMVASIGPKMTVVQIQEDKDAEDRFKQMGIKLSMRGAINHQYAALRNWEANRIKSDFIGIILGQQAVIESVNRGFRLRQDDERLVTYQQRKDVCSYWHSKSIILPDCVHTALTPL